MRHTRRCSELVPGTTDGGWEARRGRASMKSADVRLVWATSFAQHSRRRAPTAAAEGAAKGLEAFLSFYPYFLKILSPMGPEAE